MIEILCFFLYDYQIDNDTNVLWLGTSHSMSVKLSWDVGEMA